MYRYRYDTCDVQVDLIWKTGNDTQLFFDLLWERKLHQLCSFVDCVHCDQTMATKKKSNPFLAMSAGCIAGT